MKKTSPPAHLLKILTLSPSRPHTYQAMKKAMRREILQCQYNNNRGGAESPPSVVLALGNNKAERGSSTLHTKHVIPIPFLGGSEAAEEALLVALQTRINIDVKKVKEYTHHTKEELHKFQARCLEDIDIEKKRALAAAAAANRPWPDRGSTEGQRKAQSSRDFGSIPHAEEGQQKDDLDVAVQESVGRLQSDHVTAGQASKQRPRKFSLKKVRTLGLIALFNSIWP
jgi:hypothetical protein